MIPEESQIWVSRAWEPPAPPTDLIFDDGEPLESNRHRIAMNTLIRSLQQAWVNCDDFLSVAICLSTTAQKTEQERQRAERLAAKLRQFGVDPSV